METLTVHEVGKKSAMVRSLRELERREEKEGRGFARRGGVQMAIFPKEEGPSSMGVRVGIKSRQGAGKGEKAHYANGQSERGTMPWPNENGGANGPRR